MFSSVYNKCPVLTVFSVILNLAFILISFVVCIKFSSIVLLSTMNCPAILASTTDLIKSLPTSLSFMLLVPTKLTLLPVTSNIEPVISLSAIDTVATVTSPFTLNMFSVTILLLFISVFVILNVESLLVLNM